MALLVSHLASLPDLAETVVIAAQLASDGSLPGPAGPRARKAEFVKRCQAALVKKNPLAELDTQKLPREDQRKVAMALDATKHLCSHCPKPAETSLEFSLAWVNGLPEPDPAIRWFCHDCTPSHPAVCPNCGKHDTLVQEGVVTSLARFHGSHIIGGLRCSDCQRLAMAPMTPAEQRKADNYDHVRQHCKYSRLCL